MITTDRLLLRPLGNDDIAITAEAVVESLPDLLPWMPWAHAAYDADDAESWIGYSREMWSLGREFGFGVFSRGRYLGSCSIDRIDWPMRRANLGYWIRSSEVGAGFATEAARAVAAWAFRVHALHRIDVVVTVGNVRSERTAARIGAQREGIARNGLVIHGQPRDAVVFGLLPADLAPPGGL